MQVLFARIRITFCYEGIDQRAKENDFNRKLIIFDFRLSGGKVFY